MSDKPQAGGPSPPAAPRALTPLERLLREPARFSIDAAARVLAPDRDPTTISFRSVARLSAPGGEVAQARPDRNELVTTTFGLIGAGGVLPRHYTALVDAEAAKRSTALHAFLDLLARRFTGLYVKAGAKFRPTRSPRLTEEVLASAVGLGTSGLTHDLHTPLRAVLFHAGGLANRSRSTERLRGMLSEELGGPVRIVEFAGGWVRVPASEQSRMQVRGAPGRHIRLGRDAALGSQLWDPTARFLIQLGPLCLEDFKALLPGTPLHARLVDLTRLHVGLEQDFALNPILAEGEVLPLQLGAPETAAGGGAQLGWTSWMTSPKPRSVPAKDALLRPSAFVPPARAGGHSSPPASAPPS